MQDLEYWEVAVRRGLLNHADGCHVPLRNYQRVPFGDREGVEESQRRPIFEKNAFLRQIAEYARGPVHALQCMQGTVTKPAAILRFSRWPVQTAIAARQFQRSAGGCAWQHHRHRIGYARHRKRTL